MSVNRVDDRRTRRKSRDTTLSGGECYRCGTINIGGIPVEVIIDSGASANVINQALWEKLKKQHIKCVSRRSTKTLYAYGVVTPLEVIETFMADLTLGSKSVSAEVTVIKGQGEPLLGRESATEFGCGTCKSR